MTKNVLRFAMTLFVAICCSSTLAQQPRVNLLELVQRQAELSLTYADRHPEVVDLDSELSERIASGENFDLRQAAKRFEQLLEERKGMSRKLGQAHRRMLINALQIRAVAGILQDFESMPLLPHVARKTAVPVAEHTLVKDLEYNLAAVGLLQQLEGEWEIEQVVVQGKPLKQRVRERFRIEDNLLQLDYPIERISSVPRQHRAAFEKPWEAVGFSPRLEAIEFQKVIFVATNDWRPVLCRRYVTYRNGKLLMVCADNPHLPVQTLDSGDDNYVFLCRKTTTNNR